MTTLYAADQVFAGQGPMRPGHGVLVEDGRIRRVAPMAEFDGFAGPVVQAPDTTLLPGLIDCHVHMIYRGDANPRARQRTPGQVVMECLQNAQADLAGGITSIRDCGGMDHLEFAVRDACNEGRQLGPTIRAAGRMICMTGGHGNFIGRVADGPDEVVKAVREQIHAGADLVKLMATGGVMTPGVDPEDAHYSLEEMTAGVAEGHRFHKTCASHAQGAAGIVNAVRAGVDSIEHGIFLTEACVTLMLEAGTYLVPTLSALVNMLDNRDQGVPAFMVEKAERAAEHHRRSIRMFYKAGGKLAMGTDAGTPFNFHGLNARELRYMADLGLAPLDVLQSATVNAADLMRLADRGRIEDGAHADLLLVAGDPSVDIDAAADPGRHLMVVKNGIVAHDRRPPTAVAAKAAE